MYIPNIPIYVWYNNNILDEWILKLTEDFVETKDEEKYFRMINTLGKHFYYSKLDYYTHNKDRIQIPEWEPLTGGAIK